MGAGYGKEIRKQMSSYNTANPNATAQDKLGQRKTALTAAEGAMSQPGAAQSSRITNRLSRINKPGKVGTPPTPTPSPSPAPSTKPPVGGGGTPLPKPGILPGEENRVPPTTNPMPTTNTSTSLKKKKRQPVTTNPSPLM
jgi:hypothetical protein